MKDNSPAMNAASAWTDLKETGWLRPSVIALLAANMVPLVGVIALDWEVFPLMVLFWMENVIIGMINVLKMAVASPGSAGHWAGKLFLIPFFCVHYGIFTFAHGTFVIGFFGGGANAGGSFSTGVLRLLEDQYLWWAVLGLAVSHALSFATNYIGRGEYQKAILPLLMFQPYGRVIVLHLTIIFGAMLMMALQSPTAGLVLLVALKTAVDLGAHLKERRKFSPKPEDRPGTT